ncbi:MAG: VCBS repeat-containing protein [Rhodothermales bacterium]|nr:VCBS repeat-containing protein [Rhodothermales bacterium]
MNGNKLSVSILALAMIAIAGCSGSSSVVKTSSSDVRYERKVDPFTVTTAEGKIFDHPFHGGLNAPRPQFLDIDGDADLDLFVQETTDELVFFENVGSPESPSYTWRTDHFQDLETGDWFRFADLDMDGDYDLLSEEKYSLVRYYRNDGTVNAPSFTLAADTLRDVDGTAIFADRQNIPYAQDIDCDEKVDLFIGLLIGTVMRYELDHYDDQMIPIFKKLTDRFEDIEIVGDLPGSRHGANTLTFNDIDGDGDLDLFWGDFFEEGILLVRNTGSCRSPVLRSEPVQYPLNNPVLTSGYNAPMFADLDADGNEELFVGVVGGAFNATKSLADNFYELEQTSPGVYKEETARFLLAIDLGSESIVTLVDYDNDGDLDFTVGNKINPRSTLASNLVLFENTGTSTEPAFREAGEVNVDASYHYAPTFGDLDGDGDTDMLLGTWNEGMLFYRNVGTASEPDYRKEDYNTVELTRGGNSTPVLVDIDSDGDLDLFAGESSGTINYYLNNGTPQKHKFDLVTDELNSIDIGRRSNPSFTDIDGDGDHDLFVGSDSEGITMFRNVGTVQSPEFAAGEPLDINVDQFSNVDFGDLNGNGLIDIVSGGLGGGVRYFEGTRTAK